jgi:DNA-directed RNA polymerase I, II, and III subunit RPABC2
LNDEWVIVKLISLKVSSLNPKMDDEDSPNFDTLGDDIDEPLDNIDEPFETPLPGETDEPDSGEGAEGGDNGTGGSEELSVEILTSEDVVQLQSQPNQERVTLPILTRYERGRVLGARAIQISHGAPPLIDTGGELDPVRIAEMELRARKSPLIIRRFLPNGTHEDWSIQELKFLDLF